MHLLAQVFMLFKVNGAAGTIQHGMTKYNDVTMELLLNPSHASYDGKETHNF